MIYFSLFLLQLVTERQTMPPSGGLIQTKKRPELIVENKTKKNLAINIHLNEAIKFHIV